MKTITLPGSKSITNRDLLLASLAEGKSTLRGFLTSDDTVHMVNALKTLGISVQQEDGILFIEGGLSRIRGDGKELFLGNSGTSTRFLTALAALNEHGDIIITGDERMKQRPIKDLVDGVEQLGVVVKTNDGFLPIVIKGGEETQNTLVKMKGNSSSQYFTAILQIAPLLKNGLTIEVIGDLVSKPYIDITLNEMAKFGVEVENDTYKV
ncbi:MAG: 3-phosphoshikimate 1-carboxyvinyltransferase, partial [Candidatus Gracilibacteria bacterium]|nr:3-phosphoshikimate 1-carboxyvinyltransferase [Candidatus Gracilibacteria bacterium]